MEVDKLIWEIDSNHLSVFSLHTKLLTDKKWEEMPGNLRQKRVYIIVQPWLPTIQFKFQFQMLFYQSLESRELHRPSIYFEIRNFQVIYSFFDNEFNWCLDFPEISFKSVSNRFIFGQCMEMGNLNVNFTA